MKVLKSASIDLTYQCNFRCKHCFNASGEHMNRGCELTDKEILKVVDDLKEIQVESVCLCGGEALLRKELLFECCRQLKENGIRVSTVSNGYLLDRFAAKGLKDAGIDVVQISIDGATEETHDWMRNKEGSYRKAIDALSILHDEGVRTETAFVPTKRNITELEAAIDNAIKLGAEAFRIQPIMNLGRAKKFLTEYFLDNNEYMVCKTVLDRKRKQYIHEDFIIEWADPIEHLQFYSRLKNVLNYLSISAYGDILVTPYLSISFGNIKRHSLRDYIDAGLKQAWQNSVLKEIVKNLHSTEDMDVSKMGLPEIFVEKNIELDLLSSDYKIKTEKVMRDWRR